MWQLFLAGWFAQSAFVVIPGKGYFGRGATTILIVLAILLSLWGCSEFGWMTSCEHKNLDARWSHGAGPRCVDYGAIYDGEWIDPVQSYLRMANSDNHHYQEGAKHMRRYLDIAREQHGIPYPK